VDLPATGITAVVDTFVPTTPTVPAWRPVVTDVDEPLVVTVTGDRKRGRRAVLIAAGAAVLVVAALAALLVRPGTAATGDDTAPTDTASAPSAVADAGTARLVSEPVTAAPGDRMRALAALSSGAVAVGSSDADGAPRAWLADAGGAWIPATVAQPAGLVGGMNGVAAAPGGRLVAVGWLAPAPAPGAAAPIGDARGAAVWTSTDGATWTLRDKAVGGAGLGELTDVVVGPTGGFVASGTDWRADPRTGDGAVLTSADGATWRALPVVGLGGRGQTVLHRLLVDGGGYVAVGTRPDGGIGQPAVWTSPDAVTWSPGPLLPHAGIGGGDATGVARLPGGPLVVVGTTSTVGGRSAAVWSGADPAGLVPSTVDDPDAVLEGVGVRNGRLTAVGAGNGGGAAWTLQLGP
jgi:hypothetical protein